MRRSSTNNNNDTADFRSRLPLHAAVFDNDCQTMTTLLNQGQCDVDQLDVHGNSPLHLSVSLGHHEITLILLSHNASVKLKNSAGWSSLAEVTALLQTAKRQSHELLRSRKPHLLQLLTNLQDFYLEVKWEFYSWIPFLSRALPSDVCKIYKRGSSLRFDTTLVDFAERTWQRGDLSFIYDSQAEDPDERMFIVDNRAHCYQRLKTSESTNELDEEVDVLMSNDNVNVCVHTKQIRFKRLQTGWIFKQDQTTTVGAYESDVYQVENLCLESKKRREHLNDNDVQKNKTVLNNLTKGHLVEHELNHVEHRASLPRPQSIDYSFDDYCTACEPPIIGRQPVLKKSVKQFQAQVYMSTEFPIAVEALMDIIEVATPFRHMNKLRRFCQMQLPPGFPVKLELPLFPTITAKVTFQKLQFRNDLSLKMFKIPKSYREDSSRFPEL